MPPAEGNFDVYKKITPFEPNTLNFIFEIRDNDIFFITIAVNVIFAAAVFAGFALIMEKRADRGC